MKQPTVKNRHRNLSLRYLTGMWPVRMLRALPITRPLKYEKTSPVLDEQGPWLCFLTFPPVENTGFPWGCWDIFYTTQTIQKAQILTNTFVFLAYCSRHAVSRGIKYFRYGLWVNWIACDIQEEVSIGYLEVPSWPYYETLIWTAIFFKALIPKHRFGYHCRKWSALLP